MGSFLQTIEIVERSGTIRDKSTVDEFRVLARTGRQTCAHAAARDQKKTRASFSLSMRGSAAAFPGKSRLGHSRTDAKSPDRISS
jgi:hypothetical protein